MIRFVLAIAALALATVSPAHADAVSDFYKGKTVTIYVGFTPGGNYDLYARMLSEFMPRHMPGNPQLVVQNKPGAASLNAAQSVMKVLPQDGLSIAMTANMLPLEQLLEGANAAIDMKKARWLGNMVELTSAAIVWHDSPIKTLDEMKQKETVFGSTGPSGETYVVPLAMNAILGTKIKVVAGYPGITEVMVALERGEIQGRSGSWQNVLQHPDWIAGKKIIPIVQVGVRKHPDLAGVPQLSELAKTPEDKQLADLVSNSIAVSRAPWVGPGVPEERVKALRAAFDATMKDPEFVKVAQERNVELTYMSGEDVEKRLSKSLDVSPELVTRLKTILEPK